MSFDPRMMRGMARVAALARWWKWLAAITLLGWVLGIAGAVQLATHHWGCGGG